MIKRSAAIVLSAAGVIGVAGTIFVLYDRDASNEREVDLASESEQDIAVRDLPPTGQALAPTTLVEKSRIEINGDVTERQNPADPPESGSVPLEKMMLERDQLKQELRDAAHAEYNRRFEIGLGELVGTGHTYDVPDTDVDSGDLTGFVFDRGGGIYKIVLPAGEYPELYAKQQRISELDQEIERRGLVPQK